MDSTFLNSRLIEVFRAVMTVGTVTAAAELLNTSQPALSRSLQRLETVVGFRLFARTKGRLVPTARAISFFEEVQRMYLGLEHLANAAQKLKSLQTGHVGVVCAPVFSSSLIAEAVSRFKAKHGEATVTIETQLSSTIAEAMAAQRFDIGLAASAVSPRGVTITPFAETAEVCVLPPGHPLAAREIVDLPDLAEEGWISFASSDPARYRLDALFEAIGIRRKTVVEAHHSSTVCEMVLRGIGIAIVNPFTALEFSRRGLIARPLKRSIPFNAYLLKSSYRPASPLVDGFVSSLKEVGDEFGEEFKQWGAN